MACYQCNGCGKCEMGRVFNYKPLAGSCPVCQTANPPEAVVCEKCGMSLPKPPGSFSRDGSAGAAPASRPVLAV